MEVATGKFLLILTRPTPKPMAGGPKKCWNWAREPPTRQERSKAALAVITEHLVMPETSLKWRDAGPGRVISRVHGLVEIIISFCHITHSVTDTGQSTSVSSAVTVRGVLTHE